MNKVCKRCGKEFSNPIPEVKNPDGIREVATVECCADCNALIMWVLYRDRSAYRLSGQMLR